VVRLLCAEYFTLNCGFVNLMAEEDD